MLQSYNTLEFDRVTIEPIVVDNPTLVDEGVDFRYEVACTCGWTAHDLYVSLELAEWEALEHVAEHDSEYDAQA